LVNRFTGPGLMSNVGLLFVTKMRSDQKSQKEQNMP
jgi:hypothetical protein